MNPSGCIRTQLARLDSLSLGPGGDEERPWVLLVAQFPRNDSGRNQVHDAWELPEGWDY